MPTLEEAKGWEYTPGHPGLQLPIHEQGLHGLPKPHHHPAPLWDVPPAQPHHGTQLDLCWRMSSAWVVPQLWERTDVHSLRSRVQEAIGTPKATLLSLLQLMAAASFHPSPSSCG